MLSNRTNQWTVGAALICVVLLAASWFLLITPRRAHAADLRSQAEAATSQAQQVQLETARLKAQFGDLPKEKAQLAAIKAQLPPKASMSALVTDLANQAASSGVVMTEITVGAPTVVSGASTTGSSTSLAPAGSVVAVPVTLIANGDYFEDALFTKYVQTKLTRSFLVKSVTTSSAAAVSTPAATGTASPTPTPTATTSASSSVSLSLAGSVFVLVDSTTSLRQIAKDAKDGVSTGAK